VQLYDVSLSALNTPDTSSIEIKSELIDAAIFGKFKLSTLPSSLENMADYYVNLVPGKDPGTDTVNRFTYRVDFKHVKPILDFFFPKLEIAENSSIYGTYNPSNQILMATGAISKLGIGSNAWYNAVFHAVDLNNEFDLDFRSDSMVFGKTLALENQQLHLFTINDTARLNIIWDNQSEAGFNGEINLNGAFQPDSLENRGFLVTVEPSEVEHQPILHAAQEAVFQRR
jgi:hypothetical protein